ncbi:MAG: phosphomannomutase CpsG [Cycloclasticus sp.]
MTERLSCFKAYDIRGQLGTELDEDIAYRIGRAFGEYLQAKKIVIGGDIRETSPALKAAVANGLKDAGVDVLDIGMVGTEEIYFATKYLGVDGGVEVTASHNPIDYNGMKLVREDSKPISGDTGLNDIQQLAEQNDFKEIAGQVRGTTEHISTLSAYVDHLLTYLNTDDLKPLKLVVNAGNGAAGHVIDELEKRFQQASVPIEFIKIHHEADGSFPHGIPNPLLVENRPATAEAVKAHGADMGIAWDGDFDRCFLFDENGDFIEGYYIVGLLADAFLATSPEAKIIYDPRLTWNTIDIVEAAGGEAIMSKTGHAFIKERMRKEDAVYGGEMSAHHYFRDFAYCDSGMIPWLLVAGLLNAKNKNLSQLVAERIAAYPSSGEINSKLEDPEAAINRVLSAYQEQAVKVDLTDGIGVEFENWRFNLRRSNTEPVVRLNVESKGDVSLMKEKTSDILALLLA